MSQIKRASVATWNKYKKIKKKMNHTSTSPFPKHGASCCTSCSYVLKCLWAVFTHWRRIVFMFLTGRTFMFKSECLNLTLKCILIYIIYFTFFFFLIMYNKPWRQSKLLFKQPKNVFLYLSWSTSFKLTFETQRVILNKQKKHIDR